MTMAGRTGVRAGRPAAGTLAGLLLLTSCGPAEGPDPAREDPAAPDEAEEG
jgi:hypothetical protein